MLSCHPNRSTVFRWVQKGCSGVCLRTVSVGRTRHTTERWLLSFFEAVAAARDNSKPDVVARGSNARRKASRPDMRARTVRILREHGLSEFG